MNSVIPFVQFSGVPFLSAAQYASQAGGVRITDKVTMRYFAPQDTGINGALAYPLGDPFDLPPGFTYRFLAVTKPLDCSGCTRFTLGLTIAMTNVAHDSFWNGMQVLVQPCPVQVAGIGAITPRLGYRATQDLPVVGNTAWERAYPFGYPAAPGVNRRSASLSWSASESVAGINNGSTGSFRLIMRNAAPTPPGVKFTMAGFYAELWAST
jgi:hypothetical protein